MEHLRNAGLLINNKSTSGGIKDIYFDTDKGARVKELLKEVYRDFHTVIFVDDLEGNLNDVKEYNIFRFSGILLLYIFK